MEQHDSSEFVITLADRLRKAASVAGYTNTEMAEKLAVSRHTVARWLNESSRPSMGYIRAWSQATGAPLDWLLDDDKDDQADVA